MHLPLRLWLWILALGAVLWVFRKARGSLWSLTLLVFPGTCAHELCHLGVGWITNGRPVRFSLMPRRKANAYELGSVAFANMRWYNAFFIGMAPLLLIAGAWGIVHWRMHYSLAFSWVNALWLYLVANLLESALPSGQDFRVAARSPIGWLLLAALLGWIGFMIRKRYFAMPSTKPTLTEREL
jgi:hypothetical protein